MTRPVHIQVLGCKTGNLTGFFAPSLLIDGNILLDAGSFGCSLPIARQLKIDHVLLSHAHHDHVKDLAEFADLVIGRRARPVQIHATAESLRVLRENLFNNRLWPDFFSLPSPAEPILVPVPIEPDKPFRIGRLTIRAILVSHPVEAVGFLVRRPGGSFVYSGDTGPTDALWRAVRRLRDLKLILMETKFPNELQMVADAAGHLTPMTLAAELHKFGAESVPIVLYHLKPDQAERIERQIARLGDRRLRIMSIGDSYRV
jgi:ribonuclease BN (tRNA processing enzyme)